MLTQDGDWYTIEVPGWINSVIINGNGGSVQTADLSVDAGKDIWVVITGADSAVVTYEEPAAAPEITEPQETEPEATEPTPTEEPKDPSTGLIIGIVAAVALVGGGAALVVSRKKKS